MSVTNTYEPELGQLSDRREPGMCRGLDLCAFCVRCVKLLDGSDD
nr:hypothetical protein Q903MT_gene5262 [Picea sitchensis]